MKIATLKFAARLLPFSIPAIVACIDVGHEAETGCLVDTSAPGCRATAGRGGSATGGTGRGGSSVGGAAGAGGSSSATGGTGGSTNEAGAAGAEPEGGAGGA
jgi:hypothetical protein